MFQFLEATVDEIQKAYESGDITARQLVEAYLKRIEAYDSGAGGINSIITINPAALDEADRADVTRATGKVVGAMHGIPVVLKDQMDAMGMPTTLGSVMFKDYYPDRDATVTARLRQAGAIILAKATLGELGAGDTHGSLFGSTRNPYDLERTVGGSSGGPAAAVAANLTAVAVGQEGYASIRRPAGWNGIVGMRPTAGLVSRAGVYAGWPQRHGSLGPLTRTVADAAKLLDVIVGYDSEDPLTAHGYGHVPDTYTASLGRNGLEGSRIGVLRTAMGTRSEPDSEDFAKVTAVFDRAIGELVAAGAVLIDPIEIPDLNLLLETRTAPSDDEAFSVWASRSRSFPYASYDELRSRPEFASARPGARGTSNIPPFDSEAHYQHLKAEDELMTNVLKVMADNQLDAIVHKTVEHQPTLIREGLNPPYYNGRGAAHLNTFLIYAASLTIPAGFTRDELPVGITFFGRPYSEATLLSLGYAYEQSTKHRRPPANAPALPDE